MPSSAYGERDIEEKASGTTRTPDANSDATIEPGMNAETGVDVVKTGVVVETVQK
jgi:hypothetical protein